MRVSLFAKADSLLHSLRKAHVGNKTSRSTSAAFSWGARLWLSDSKRGTFILSCCTPTATFSTTKVWWVAKSAPEQLCALLYCTAPCLAWHAVTHCRTACKHLRRSEGSTYEELKQNRGRALRHYTLKLCLKATCQAS